MDINSDVSNDFGFTQQLNYKWAETYLQKFHKYLGLDSLVFSDLATKNASKGEEEDSHQT